MRTLQSMNTSFRTLGLLTASLLFGFQLFGQVMPYYVPASDLADDELKAALHNLINNHTTYPYTSGSTDVWDMLKLTDRDPENAENVVLLYSGRSTNAAQEYNNGNGWNREHVWPSSRGGFGNSQGAGTDAHHLRPCDIQVNNQRGNRFFATCVSCTEVFSQGLPTGSFRDNVNGTFEPRNAVKGDVARMIFYMAVRYEGNGEPDLELVDEVLAEGNNAPLMGVLSDLLAWNAADPVDAFELNRNEVIFDFQGNRNPFVDYPELAEHLWGSLQGVEWPSSLRTDATSEGEALRLYPNPAREAFRVSAEVDRTLIRSVQGGLLMQVDGEEFIHIGALPAGVYLVELYTKDGFRSVQRLVKL